MLRKKIMEIISNIREVVVRRKKEVAIGVAGVVLVGGVVGGACAVQGGVFDRDTIVAVDSKADEKEGDKEEIKVEEEKKENKEVNLEETETIEVAEVVEVPDGHVLDKNGNVVPVVEVADSDIPVIDPSDYIKDENVSNNNAPSNTGGTASNNTVNSKPVQNTTNSGTSTNNKPVQNTTTNNTNNGTNNNTNNNKPAESKPVETPKPQEPSKPVETPKPEHVHNWVAVTEQVNHDEVGHWETVVIKEAWTESVPVYEDQVRSICNTCGADITGNTSAHVKQHMLAGEDNGGHRTETVKVQVGTNTINHPAVTDKKWIVDKAAWVETVTTGYTCSGCGAKK